MRTYSILPIVLFTTVLFLGQSMTAFARFCEPLPPPAGNIIHVDPSQTGNLTSIVSGTNPGDTILFADGTYPLNGVYLWVSTPGLTIRSASGNREAVILDGNYQTTEIVTVTASQVTIADLTLKRAKTHAVHVVPASTAVVTSAIPEYTISISLTLASKQSRSILTLRLITRTMARSPAAESSLQIPGDPRFWKSMVAAIQAVWTHIRPGGGL